MGNYIIKEAVLVNEGKQFVADLLIKNERIERIDPSISNVKFRADEINAVGKYLLPGCIDDQVHFREPGLTHKATIFSESQAAVAGGVTSFMEMPNTVPNAVTNQLLEDKYRIASTSSAANYSFYLGGTNDNIKELLAVDHENVCGLKLFMGSSTGNMLVDDEAVLEEIFSSSKSLIAIHSESEPMIQANLKAYKEEYPNGNVPWEAHPLIRSREACYQSTVRAINLAKKYGTRLHVLHISTAEECALFDNTIPLHDKKITAEACVHHLSFNDNDYEKLGGLIKCNPAIKTENDRLTILKAVIEDRIDVIATDHAPHTLEEKNQNYFDCPSGLPLVQFPLLMMIKLYQEGKISLEKIVQKMAHNPAILFNINERGYLHEGYYADLVLVNPKGVTYGDKNLFYKCQWSPLKDVVFENSIESTFVNGNKVFDKGVIKEGVFGKRLIFGKRG
jgi:dihydroorotase